MAMRDWAKFLNDNRIGPIVRDLADALEETEDPALLRTAEVTLRNMANSASSLKWQRKEEQRKRNQR